MSLVPQALTGELPVEPEEGRRGHRRNRPPSVESAAIKFFTGISFLLVSLAVWRFFPGGFVWWFWLLIPAFSSIGSGIGQYLKVRELERKQQPYLDSSPGYHARQMPGYKAPVALPEADEQTPTTSELKVPGSIAEHTTRHLDSDKQKSE